MEELNEHIDDYVRGKLQGKIREDFEAKLKQDPKLAQTVEEQKIIIEGITAFGQQELKAQLKGIHQDLFESAKPQQAKVRRLNWRPFAVAASIALIASIAYWSMFTAPNYEQLYASNFEPYAINFASRTSEPDTETIQLQELYLQQDYQQALPGLERLAEAQPQQGRVQLALAISYLAEGQSNKAINQLSGIEDPLLQGVVQWYQALAHIRLGEKEEAEQLLQQLASSDSNYQAQAQILLEELQ